jgi:D-arabinose 1-dehydrogenase-like Zn-dependent alcohol dehydrogenase
VRAVVYDEFQRLPAVRSGTDPDCPPDGVVVAVRATGLCRSDWHAWMGHDPDVSLPHVPGHEFAGVVAEVGPAVTGWSQGDRVTAPFVYACGRCEVCLDHGQNVCPNQAQPGFTVWGSFAELVVVHHADVNLVALPSEVSFATAAALGCRFATAYRAVVHQGRVRPGQWLAVYGCGGVGLSAVMIAASRGVRVVAVDVSGDALGLATRFGASAVVDAGAGNVGRQVLEVTDGGAHVSVDAIGRADTFALGLAGLRRRGRHVQVGLLLAEEVDPRVDMGSVVAHELEIVGSHGMAAADYPEMMAEIAAGRLDPARLVTRAIGLDDAPAALAAMDRPGHPGTTVIVIGGPDD